MSKPVSSTLIGAFVLGGLGLLVGGLLLFGGSKFFKTRVSYVVYFDSSVNGLMIGAPVSIQGVQVGSVKDIDIMFDQEHNAVLKPVVLELDLETLRDSQGREFRPAFTLQKRKENLQKLIDAGMRARLEPQSFLTGRLYVDLSFYPGEPARLVGREYEGHLEIPSVPARGDELRNTLDEVMRQFRRIPFDRILNDVTVTLDRVRQFVSSEEFDAARKDLAVALREARSLLANLNSHVAPLASELRQTNGEVTGLVRDLREDLKPLVKRTEAALKTSQHTLETATDTMKKLQGTLDAADDFTAPDSNLDQTIVELRETARAVRALADAIERQPDALLFGK
ncbi:MAG: MCE family protein [Gammaproteobacteria bacterium]|nr:MCE family protein [Gammaproteobacteria bacterium]